jgi:hypothetical protein
LNARVRLVLESFLALPQQKATFSCDSTLEK